MSRAFAYKTLASHLKTSTSGGAFYQIVDIFYQNGGGTVYGAILDKDLKVRHARATNKQECKLFQKSKYVRSDITNIYIQIAEDLCNNLRVLFTGTPCQVNGLKKYLAFKHLKTENLFTVDLICNGAPKQFVWEEYKKWLEHQYNKKLTYFAFREKGDRYNPYLTKACFSDGFTLVDSPKTACYNRLFLKKLIIPEGCFNCPFKKEERISDITLGDFWGSERILNSKSLQHEVSLVLVNTKKGEQLFCPEMVDSEESIILELFNREYLQFQRNLVCPTTIPKDYETFWNDYSQNGLAFVLDKYADAYFPWSIKYTLRKFVRILKSIQKYV